MNLYAAFRDAFPQDLDLVCLETDKGREIIALIKKQLAGTNAKLLGRAG